MDGYETCKYASVLELRTRSGDERIAREKIRRLRIRDILNDEQILTVKWLERLVGRTIDRQGIIDQSHLPRTLIDVLMEFLENVGAVKVRSDRRPFVVDYGPLYEVCPKISEVVRRINDPYEKDFWQALSIWFHSKWWSIPIKLLVVFVAILGGCFAITRFILDCSN